MSFYKETDMDKILLPQIKNVDKYWFDNNALLTHFMSALSILFPKGELFFMHSLVAYRKDYPELMEDITRFCQEERMHSVKHTELNTILDAGKLLELEQRTYDVIHRYTKYMTKRQKLAVTICLEHITFIMATELLERLDITSRMKSDAKTLFLWHAQEETSNHHSTIAQRVFDREANLDVFVKVMMIPVTIALIKTVLQFWIEIVRNDKEHLNVVYAADAINTLFGLDGYVTRMVPKYLKFYIR